ncbi:hypothetical protein MM5_215 [Morganella phage vB_Mm5]
MNRLLRKTKFSSTCSVPGHGCKCCVSKEIQSDVVTRTKEKRIIKKQIDYEIKMHP